MDSMPPDDPTANMTPAEPIGEVQQGLPFCECNVLDDWCVGGKHCRAAVIPCVPTAMFCGSLLKKPCNGWCLD